jgi:hypothetical protein
MCANHRVFSRTNLAQGNIGSSAGGLPFLEDEDIIPVILEIAEQSQVLSVRGYDNAEYL